MRGCGARALDIGGRHTVCGGIQIGSPKVRGCVAKSAFSQLQTRSTKGIPDVFTMAEGGGAHLRKTGHRSGQWRVRRCGNISGPVREARVRPEFRKQRDEYSAGRFRNAHFPWRLARIIQQSGTEGVHALGKFAGTGGVDSARWKLPPVTDGAAGESTHDFPCEGRARQPGEFLQGKGCSRARECRESAERKTEGTPAADGKQILQRKRFSRAEFQVVCRFVPAVGRGRWVEDRARGAVLCEFFAEKSGKTAAAGKEDTDLAQILQPGVRLQCSGLGLPRDVGLQFFTRGLGGVRSVGSRAFEGFFSSHPFEGLRDDALFARVCGAFPKLEQCGFLGVLRAEFGKGLNGVPAYFFGRIREQGTRPHAGLFLLRRGGLRGKDHRYGTNDGNRFEAFGRRSRIKRRHVHIPQGLAIEASKLLIVLTDTLI